MYADYHVHSIFSDDSNYPIEEVCRDACRLGLDEICFTDHVDYGIKYDLSPLDAAGTLFDKSYAEPKETNESTHIVTNVDYQHYFPAIAAARRRWGTAQHDWWGGTLRVRCGLELGLQRHTIDSNQHLVDARKDELDFVLLSCHQIDDLEFWSNDYQKGKAPEAVTQAYYEEIFACQQLFKDYSVLAHLDAIKRDNPADKRPFSAYREVVAAILEQAIRDGKGIELNTSSVRYGLSDWQPCKEILSLYRDLGGQIITVGSDSHQPAQLGSYLRQGYDLLHSLGFEGVYHFEQMTGSLVRFD